MIKRMNDESLLKIEELEERIAPDGMGNNNPPLNNTLNSGNEGTGGEVSSGSDSGSGDTSDNNNPGENNTNLPGDQPKD
jgi:hypothetical protein